MINISICLTDLPKEKITTSEKNGKKYINLVVDALKEKDQYGKTHTIYLSQSKEEREAKEKKVYVGSGREYVFEAKSEAKAEAKSEPIPSGDLPF